MKHVFVLLFSAAQSLSKHSDLEAMVKTLAPALLAELAKMKSLDSTSSAPSSSSGKHEVGVSGGCAAKFLLFTQKYCKYKTQSTY